jgi:hypothetical protein
MYEIYFDLKKANIALKAQSQCGMMARQQARADADDVDENEDLFLILLCLALCHEVLALDEEMNDEEEHEETRLLFHEPPKYASRRSIPLPEFSSWQHLNDSRDETDETWFTWVGLPKVSFLALVNECEPYWKANAQVAWRGDHAAGTPTPQHIGNRLLDCAGTMAIALKFLTCTVNFDDLAKAFGVVATVARKYVMFGIDIIVEKLLDHEFCRVEWLNEDEEYLEQMSELTHYYVPDLTEDWGHKPVAWIDAVRLPIANKWSRPRERREDQSGEKKMTLRKCILLSDPRGKIVGLVLNIPGSWGDSKGTRLGGLYDVIESLLEGYNVVSDTAYLGHLLTAKIVKVLKEAQRIPDGMTDEDLIELEKLITRARQPAEWTNRDFVSSFKKLRQILGIHDDINSKLMLASILIQNWRVSTCDRNQVKKVFHILRERARREAEMSDTDD